MTTTRKPRTNDYVRCHVSHDNYVMGTITATRPDITVSWDDGDMTDMAATDLRWNDDQEQWEF